MKLIDQSDRKYREQRVKGRVRNSGEIAQCVTGKVR